MTYHTIPYLDTVSSFQICAREAENIVGVDWGEVDFWMVEVTVPASPVQTKLHIIFLLISFVFDIN